MTHPGLNSRPRSSARVRRALRMRSVRAALVMLTVATAAAVAVPTPAFAAVTSVRGYAFARNTASNNTVADTYSYNSSGGPVELIRNATGNYRVRFVGLGAMLGSVGDGGTAHVDTYGYTYVSCTVGGWFNDGTDLDVAVNCFDPGGARADAPVLVNFVAAAGTGTVDYSYLWANQPTSASYVPDAYYRWDATGSAPSILRDGVGAYRVYLPASTDRATGESFYQVTAYSSSPVRCKPNAIVGAAPGWLGVKCRTFNGAQVDSRFTITYAVDPLLTMYHTLPPLWGAAHVHVATSGTAQLTWSENAGGEPAATVTRFGPGSYQLNWLDYARVRHPMVLAEGLNNNRCVVTSFITDSSYTQVWCTTSTGTPTDSSFFLGFSA